MPLTRYRVRSEYGLADPELYRAADKDDPEALLEGVAMAGLVGVLRQLGDLAEFAAEIFHDLHEEVLATAARGHGLIVRVQQLEAEFPPIEKALLSQTNQSLFHYNAGVDWHPNLRSEQNLIARGDLPRFVMDSYEECRGPPRLFLLDKFDVAGAGACLKRYTDPSFFKVEAAASEKENVEIPREKKNRRVKHKKGLRWRIGETTPEVVPTSHTKLEQLFLEERVENGHSDPARLVKLRKRHLNGSVIDPGTGKSYMEKFVGTPEERELACDTSIVPVSFTQEYTSESGIRILEIRTVSSGEKSPSESACSSPNVHENVSKSSTNGYDDEVGDAEIIKEPDVSVNDETSERSSSLHEVQVEKQLAMYGEGRPKGTVNGYESDDVTSEVDNYMDAVASMESEMETDNEYRLNSTMHFLKAENHRTDSEANEEPIERQTQLSDSQSVGNFSTSDDGNNSFKRNRSSFSYSDSPCSMVENTPVDSDQGAKTFPSTEICGSEIVEDSSNELSVTTESLGAMPRKLVCPDTSVEEENIPAHGEASSSDCLSTQRHNDPAAFSSAASVVRPETGGTFTEYTVENGTNLVDAVATEPQVSSQISEDITKISGTHLVDESEAEDPKVSSDGVLHMADVSELASDNEDNSVNEDFETKEDLVVSNRSLGSNENEPQSNSQQQLCSSSLPDSETFPSHSVPSDNFPASCDHSDVFEPEDLVPGVDGSVSAIGVHTEDVSPRSVAEKSHMSEDALQGDSPQIPGLKETLFPDFIEDVTPVEPVSTEASVLLSEASPNTEDSGEGDFEETVSSPSHGIYLPSDAICSPSETVSLQESLTPECDVESETFQEVHDPELDSAGLGLTPSISTSYRHSSSGIWDDNEDSLPTENTQNSFSVIDSTETSTSLDARDQELKSVPSYHFNNREDGMPHPELPSGRSQVRADQLDADRVEVDQAVTQSSRGEQEDHPGQSSMPEFSSKSAGQEADSKNQASNSFESVAPNIVLVPEAAQVDLVEMPPLPPLPPMQWRMGLGTGMGMGNFHHTPLQGLFPAIQPSRTDDKAEVELLASHTSAQQPQNPVFPIASGEDEKSMHVPKSVVVNLAPPTYSMQLPAIATEANSQNSPILLSTAISSERHEHGHLAAEEEAVLSGSSSFSLAQTTQHTTTQNQDVSQVTNQPPSQLAQEAGLDPSTDQRSVQSPDGVQGSSVVTPMPPPTVADEQVLLGLLMPRWSSNKSSTVSESEAEAERENANSVPKAPRPRNPLIDEVNAHGTSKLRKFTERVRPQLEPKTDERNSLLEQIRTKSFNLKRTTATRPSIGPTFNKTNLKVAAILEKANAIRQALAGSDDEDDEDNWE